MVFDGEFIIKIVEKMVTLYPTRADEERQKTYQYLKLKKHESFVSIELAKSSTAIRVIHLD